MCVALKLLTGFGFLTLVLYANISFAICQLPMYVPDDADTIAAIHVHRVEDLNPEVNPPREKHFSASYNTIELLKGSEPPSGEYNFSVNYMHSCCLAPQVGHRYVLFLPKKDVTKPACRLEPLSPSVTAMELRQRFNSGAR